MAAEIRLQPLNERGNEILDELEQRTEKLPFRRSGTGARDYWLEAQDVDTSGFDAMLDKIDAGWRDHVTRTE